MKHASIAHRKRGRRGPGARDRHDPFHAHERCGSTGDATPSRTARILAVLGASAFRSPARPTWTASASAAHANRQTELARTNLTEVLRDHHDLRSIVTAMSINIELLGRHMDAGTGDAQVRGIADRLRDDVATCVASLQQIRARTLEELLALEQRTVVDIHAVTDEVIDAVKQRFPGVALSSRVVPGMVATVAGGAPSLRRMMFNLLVNACEGDGRRGARSIEVAVEPDRVTGRVAITIADDGPGFLRAVVATGSLGTTTKPEGTGLGLTIAEAIARASGGALRLTNRRSGGAMVVIELAA